MHTGLPVLGLAWCLQQMYHIGLYVTCCAHTNTRAVMLKVGWVVLYCIESHEQAKADDCRTGVRWLSQLVTEGISGQC